MPKPKKVDELVNSYLSDFFLDSLHLYEDEVPVRSQETGLTYKAKTGTLRARYFPVLARRFEKYVKHLLIHNVFTSTQGLPYYFTMGGAYFRILTQQDPGQVEPHFMAVSYEHLNQEYFDLNMGLKDFPLHVMAIGINELLATSEAMNPYPKNVQSILAMMIIIYFDCMTGVVRLDLL